MKVEMEVDEDGFLLFPFFFCFGTVGCLRMLFPFLFFSYRDIKKKGEEGKGECRFLEFLPPLFISRGHARN